MLTRSSTRSVLAVLAALSLFAGACGGGDDDEGADAQPASVASDDREGWPEVLRYAAVPDESSTKLLQRHEPVIDMLSEELGLDVEFTEAADYAGVIEGMIAGKLELAHFGPFSYVIARTNGADITPVAALVDEPGAEPGYQSYAITRPDTGISGLEDYAGKKVCFVDPGSTSGFLYPSAGLIEAGVITSGREADLAAGVTPVFAGGHDASAIAVKNGDCDAGFAFDDMVDVQLVDSGDLEPGDLEVVWTSEVIPGSPMAVHNDLPESLRREISRLVTEQANRDYLAEHGFCSDDDCSLIEEAWGYAEVDDAFYDGVRAVCESTKSEKCEE